MAAGSIYISIIIVLTSCNRRLSLRFNNGLIVISLSIPLSLFIFYFLFFLSLTPRAIESRRYPVIHAYNITNADDGHRIKISFRVIFPLPPPVSVSLAYVRMSHYLLRIWPRVFCMVLYVCRQIGTYQLLVLESLYL